MPFFVLLLFLSIHCLSRFRCWKRTELLFLGVSLRHWSRTCAGFLLILLCLWIFPPSFPFHFLFQDEFIQNVRTPRAVLPWHLSDSVWSFCRHRESNPRPSLESLTAQRPLTEVIWPVALWKQQSAAAGANLEAWVTGSSSCQQQWSEGPWSPDEGGVRPWHLSGAKPQPSALPADWTEREGRLFSYKPPQPPQLRLRCPLCLHFNTHLLWRTNDELMALILMEILIPHSSWQSHNILLRNCWNLWMWQQKNKTEKHTVKETDFEPTRVKCSRLTCYQKNNWTSFVFCSIVSMEMCFPDDSSHENVSYLIFYFM